MLSFQSQEALWPSLLTAPVSVALMYYEIQLINSFSPHNLMKRAAGCIRNEFRLVLGLKKHPERRLLDFIDFGALVGNMEHIYSFSCTVSYYCIGKNVKLQQKVNFV